MTICLSLSLSLFSLSLSLSRPLLHLHACTCIDNVCPWLCMRHVHCAMGRLSRTDRKMCHKALVQHIGKNKVFFLWPSRSIDIYNQGTWTFGFTNHSWRPLLQRRAAVSSTSIQLTSYYAKLDSIVHDIPSKENRQIMNVILILDQHCTMLIDRSSLN